MSSATIVGLSQKEVMPACGGTRGGVEGGMSVGASWVKADERVSSVVKNTMQRVLEEGS